MFRKGLLITAVAVLALGSTAIADDSTAAAPSLGASAQVDNNSPLNLATLVNPPLLYGDDQPAPTPAPPVVAAPSGPPEGAIMWGLDQIGVGKVLEKLNISITGYFDAGYFYDFTVPHNTAPGRSSPPTFILFPGNYKNQLMLNQVDLAIQRTIADPTKWDIGFMIEGFYGRDAVYTHSDGILDNGNKHGDTTPYNDLDLEQAYLDFSIPVGTGITVTAGKFDTLMGYEVINPTGNPLYTHGYLFSYGVPFTQTGILGAYNFNPNMKLTAGFTRGWNQSTSDNNGAIDFLGEFAWTINSKWSATFNLSEGPQSTGDNHDYWTVPEAILTWQVSDELKLAADLLYGDANAIAQWYGVAGYAGYTLNKYATINFRGEFYHDGRGFTTGAIASDGNLYTTNFIEGTLGVAISPTPDINLLQSLTIRPEVRLDTADHAVFDRSQFTQLTVGIDANIKF